VKYSGARILLESLIKNGADTIFGYPGSVVLDIYDELLNCKERIRHILVSHEQHAAHAADGYARSSGKPGICLATSGPGATNLVTGIATAFVDSVPVIAITGNVSIPLLGKDSFQEVDIAGITMPIVKHNWIVEDVHDLEEIINEAFLVAVSGRPGPVLVDIPKDITSALCEYDVVGRNSLNAAGRTGRLLERTRRVTFHNEDIEKAALLICGSKRPVIYAGGGIINSGASVQLQKLAELLDSPVVLSLMGMGAISSSHRLCAGLVGMYGTAASAEAVRKCDLLIAAGCRFSDRVTNNHGQFARNAKILHVDIDPAEINKNIASDMSITGDLKAILDKLAKAIPANHKNEWNSGIEKLKTREIENQKNTRTKYLRPRFIIQETAKALGEKTIVVTDVGQHQIWTAQYYPFKNPRSFLSSAGMGTMGFGMGAAAGAKLANPDSPVVLFSGDGCFRMNCAEMATLVKYSLPVLIIVFNNSALGMLRQWQKALYKSRYSQTDLDEHGPDFISLAHAYGASGFRVTDESSFLHALEKSAKLLESGKPALIEAVINKDEKVTATPVNK